jgi:hypothetical protein
MTNILAGKTMILMAALFISSAQQNAPGQADQSRLAAILKKSEDYCQRLGNAALDFVCLEEVTERFPQPINTRGMGIALLIIENIENTYLYDYQFIRKNQETKEKRRLIAVNRKKKNIQDSSLRTAMVQYENVLFGPVGLLSKSWQEYHEFKLIGEETINGERAAVIEATPGPLPSQPHCYGKIWIKEDDGSVLKIVWDQKSLRNFQQVEEWAKAMNVEPQITAFSEYGVEKNRLRFPSRNYIEQAYIKKDKKKSVQAETSVIYKDYKFFTVETEIEYKKNTP